MPTFDVNCVLKFDGPDEQTVLNEIIDVTDLVSCELEDDGHLIEFVGFHVVGVEEVDD